MATFGSLFQSSNSFNVKSLLGMKDISSEGPSNAVFDGYSKMDSVDVSSGNVGKTKPGMKSTSSSALPGASVNVSSGPGAVPKTGKQSSNHASAYPGSGQKSSNSSTHQPTIVSNACLSFAYSERLRKSAPEVVEIMGEHFTLDVIQDAHETLWRAAGTGRRYRKPNESTTGTPKQIRNHCASAVISKLNEMDADHSLDNIKIVCPSEELFGLMNVWSLVYNPTKPSPIEDRVRALEFKVSEIETFNQRQAKGNTFTGRQKVVNDVRNSNFPSTPQSSKRLRSPGEDSWVDVGKNGSVKPPQKRSKPSYWGKEGTVASSDLSGAEIFDVFLFNYKKIATEEVVRKHFEKHVKVVKIYQRSRDDSKVKSFVMRLENKADFEKVVNVLPWQTGARWYERQVRDPAQRSAPYFNKVNASAAFYLDRPSSGKSTPVSNLQEQWFTPRRGPDTHVPPATPVTTALPVMEMVNDQGTSVTSAAVGLSVTRMITPITVTSSVSSAPKVSVGAPPSVVSAPKLTIGDSSSTPAFSVGGPLSSVGESMSMPHSSLTLFSK